MPEVIKVKNVNIEDVYEKGKNLYQWYFQLYN